MKRWMLCRVDSVHGFAEMGLIELEPNRNTANVQLAINREIMKTATKYTEFLNLKNSAVEYTNYDSVITVTNPTRDTVYFKLYYRGDT